MVLLGPRRALLSRRAAVAAAPSGGFDATTVTGCQLWFAAYKETGLANTDPVGTLTDYSGNTRHATQATAGNKASYQTAVLNAKPVFRLDGNDFYDTSAFTQNQPFTIYWVAKKRLNDSVQQWVSNQNGGGTGYYPASNDVYGRFNTYLHLAGTLTVTNWNVLCFVVDGASSGIYYGSAATALTTGTAGTTNPGSAAYRIGAPTPGSSDGIDGDLAEFVLYSGAHGSTDRGTVLAGLAANYAL